MEVDEPTNPGGGPKVHIFEVACPLEKFLQPAVYGNVKVLSFLERNLFWKKHNVVCFTASTEGVTGLRERLLVRIHVMRSLCPWLVSGAFLTRISTALSSVRSSSSKSAHSARTTSAASEYSLSSQKEANWVWHTKCFPIPTKLLQERYPFPHFRWELVAPIFSYFCSEERSTNFFFRKFSSEP